MEKNQWNKKMIIWRDQQSWQTFKKTDQGEQQENTNY